MKRWLAMKMRRWARTLDPTPDEQTDERLAAGDAWRRECVKAWDDLDKATAAIQSMRAHYRPPVMGVLWGGPVDQFNKHNAI